MKRLFLILFTFYSGLIFSAIVENQESLNRQLRVAAGNMTIDSDLEPLKKLLDAGANPNAVDGVGCTALYWAAHTGHCGTVKLLLDYGANINFSNSKAGLTALHVAVRGSHYGLVSILLKHGADISKKTFDVNTGSVFQRNRNSTALEIAESNIKYGIGYQAIAKLIRSRQDGLIFLKATCMKSDIAFTIAAYKSAK